MIFIDYHSRVPIYEQIKEQVIMLISTSVYSPGEQLPSIRNLSKELNINVNTIKRAFNELEQDGVVNSVQGKGVFVTENPFSHRNVAKEALNSIEEVLQIGKAKGVQYAQVCSVVEKVYMEGDRND